MARRTPHYGDFGITLERDSQIPLHRQICGALRKSILNGTIREGARLPSTRALASSLSVSRNTALAAYDELIAEGLVQSRHGSGACVRREPVDSRDAKATSRGRTPREWLSGAAVPGQRLEWGEILLKAQYPLRRAGFRDPDGNALYLFDSRPQT